MADKLPTWTFPVIFQTCFRVYGALRLLIDFSVVETVEKQNMFKRNNSTLILNILGFLAKSLTRHDSFKYDVTSLHAYLTFS